MKLSNLYRIEHLLEDGAVVSINPEHPLFRGHFPSNPVTPGVALLQIATELLGNMTQKHLKLHVVQDVRFRKPVAPTARVSFVFNSVSEVNGQVSAKVSVENEGVQYAKMSLLYDVMA